MAGFCFEHPFVKGDSIELEITANVNITGWKLRCEIYDNAGSSVQLATVNSGGNNDQIEITNATDGVFLVKVAKGLTNNFENEAFIEIEKEDATGKVLTIYQGDIFFKDQKINWENPS